MRPQGLVRLGAGALSLGTRPGWTPRGLRPWAPPWREWEAGRDRGTGSGQQPVPGNSGPSRDGWNLKNNQKE